MWNTLKLDPNPEMMANFEEVLSKLTGDVQKKSAEQETLENTIRHRTSQQQVPDLGKGRSRVDLESVSGRSLACTLLGFFY
jgi:hypothetical protein